MKRRCACWAWLLLLAALAAQALGQEQRPPLLPPDVQRQAFRLPPGFEIQLVASEPAIGQPMNLRFDVRGRLWITHTLEYPYPAPGEGVEPREARFAGGEGNAPRDRLSVCEIGPGGKAERMTHFATGLNIPIGHTPVGNGSTALVYSIPSIFRCTDDNGDGVSDRRETLYTRFGNIDTHGMSSSYQRWIDGWIYGCHGFANTSEIKDQAGRVVRLVSGNTYRFRENGSHFQQFTWGQVNPFGLTFDPLGNLYSSDCHSLPVYLLLRGAQYPHFGSQAGGMGFGPTMIDHGHGSTGICGPAYYAAREFPSDFRDNIYICNPVTGRIHRDKLQRHGSTYLAKTEPDFVTCGDPNFRPVDLLLGPDGALYVADFYNPVIGHYEAPLNHPHRDRTHGRVWRIVWRGEEGEAQPPLPPNLAVLTAEQLAAKLADANLLVRTLATNYLVDAHAAAAPAAVRQAMLQIDKATVRAHGLWVLERLGALDDSTPLKMAADPEPLVRVHALKMLAERDAWSEPLFELARQSLRDDDGFVRRAAADALGQHVVAGNVRPLLEAWQAAPGEDTHLIHMLRLALRAHVANESVIAAVLAETWPEALRSRLGEIASVAESPAAIPLVLFFARPENVQPDDLVKAARQIARFGKAEHLARLIEVAPQWFAGNVGRQIQIIAALEEGLEQQGTTPAKNAALRQWFAQLATPQLAQIAEKGPAWQHVPLPGMPPGPEPWGVRHRDSTDGNSQALFWDSIVGGERLTGLLRSRPFEIPERISFWVCGHSFPPNVSARPESEPVNLVRLVLEETGTTVAQIEAPGNDVARQITWQLAPHQGKLGRIEIVDTRQANAYAWIGAGRFEPAVVVPPELADTGYVLRTLELAAKFELPELGPRLLQIAGDTRQPATWRAAAFASCERFDDHESLVSTASAILVRPNEPAELKRQAAQWLGAGHVEAARQPLAEALQRAPAALQRQLARSLVQSPAGITLLLEAAATGKAAPRLLQEPDIVALVRDRGSPEQQTRASELTANLPPLAVALASTLDRYRAAFDQARVNPENGLQLFQKHCTACHKLGPLGNMIGPQLDGIRVRGIDRLLEDVLDPNRNVDIAFRTTVWNTKDGQVFTGVERRREGNTIVLVDAQGKELRLTEGEVESQRGTGLSLMPANWSELLKEHEMRDLLGYLLAQP